MGLINQTPENYYDNGPYGEYQFVTLRTIIDQFLISYVGDNKIIPRVNKYEVEFHAHRAMQELSFDVFKSCKSQEITLKPNLQMVLPQDYVNYQQVSWVDNNGRKHRIQPTRNTSNPKPTYINEEGGHRILTSGTITSGSANIVLSEERYDIVPGMILRNANTYGGMIGTTVLSVSTTSGVTTLVMNVNATATYALPQVLEFNESGGQLNLDNEPFMVPDISTTAVGDTWMTHGTTIDSNYEKIKVGMLVHSSAFSSGTTVAAVTPVASSPNSLIISTSSGCTAVLSSAQVIFSDPNPESDTWSSHKNAGNNINNGTAADDNYEIENNNRIGLNPQFANANGTFYIDCSVPGGTKGERGGVDGGGGKIHFSSDLVGKTIVLDYISDGVGTDDEMRVHKFAEEAMYKWITHAILASTMNVPEGLVARFKKERFAAVRTAKLRLSNIKLEEITQILRGKSKQIKH